MKHFIFYRLFILGLLTSAVCLSAEARGKYDNTDTIVVARDGTGQFRSVGEAVEVCRAFMEYRKVIFVKKGVYKEKVVVPSWLTNIEIVGEDRDKTVITYDDHANVPLKETGLPMGTFRTYTVKIEGCDITLRNITIENNAERLGQAVALHTEGDRLTFVNCRFLGNQDTVYTGMQNTRLCFEDCYIEGTTDFIFGPSTAWFENCEIRSKADSYVTAASTPADIQYGYVFCHCRFTAANAQKFALLDMEYILKNIPAYERANEQLNQVSKKWQAEVEAINTEAQTMYKNYQNEVAFLFKKQEKELPIKLLNKLLRWGKMLTTLL